MRKSLWVILLNLLYLLGSAQNITVSPELVCPNQTSSLITDSTRNVHIGDIVCVDNDTGDTLIVSPSQWEALSNTHTPLSVVFFVDETGQHGWAVGNEFPYTSYSSDFSCEPCSFQDFPYYISENSNTYNDFNGLANTEHIQSYYPGNYPNFPSEPFYVPAIGQLSILYAQQNLISSSLNTAFHTTLPVDDYWWSSTIGLDEYDYVWCLSNGSTEYEDNYAFDYSNTEHYFIPVMNF